MVWIVICRIWNSGLAHQDWLRNKPGSFLRVVLAALLAIWIFTTRYIYQRPLTVNIQLYQHYSTLKTFYFTKCQWGSHILAWKCYKSYFVWQGWFLDFWTTTYPCSSVEALHLPVRLVTTYRWNIDRRYKIKMVFSPHNHLSSSHEFFGQPKTRWTCRCLSSILHLCASVACERSVLCLQDQWWEVLCLQDYWCVTKLFMCSVKYFCSAK